jgi:ABC-type branched-subunit amino acid transport system ATPase component/predicted MFS family arabinose efflux permease
VEQSVRLLAGRVASGHDDHGRCGLTLDVTDTTSPEFAGLSARILAEESARQSAQQTSTDVLLPDSLLPGVGAEPLSLPESLRRGGIAMIAILMLVTVVESFDRVAMAVLAPDIQRSLHVSDGVLGAIGGASGVLFVLGAIPIASLADRYPRTKVSGIATACWAAVVFVTGTVTNAFGLFVARMGSGLGQASNLPTHNALLADQYPIGARGRMFALAAIAGPVGAAIGPPVVGALADAAGGPDGWRWAFFAIGIAGALVSIAVLLLHEPRRGANEQLAVLGELEADDPDELPVSLAFAFERLRKIKTFSWMLVGVGALGFALFSIPLFLNLFLEQHFGLDALERGLVASGAAIPALIAVPLAGVRNDHLFRRSPPASVVLCGALIVAFGPVVVAALFMPSVALLIVVLGIGIALSHAAFAVLAAVSSSVIPYRLRSQGYAMIGVYIFLFGAFFGAVLTGLLSESLGERLALTIVVLPSSLIGGTIIAVGARFIRNDISLVVEEIIEEQEQRARLALPASSVPTLQVNNLDFSYGSVQVLFDVALEVVEGEVLALLGTNGAGKSTLLRVISGLGVPSRGVVRLDGRTITYVEPERRVKLGIVQVPGGKALFGSLTVRENLEIGGYTLRGRGRDLDRRIDAVLDRFPGLRAHLHLPAQELSGGQQQMVAIAKALLLEPRLLLIDELSLGLSPLVVQDLLQAIEQLKAEGVTMVIVEQSLNVALAIADRAVFMEKGAIRFTGTAAELRERDDLARAVFLGSARP